MPALWLADVLRAAGLTVDETQVPDWKHRGHTDGPFNPIGVLGHHTAGGATGDLPSLATVRDGRSDLAGPLAQLMLSRSGVWVPIAAGRCWHAGNADDDARWPWVPVSPTSGGRRDGNGYLIGIEAESAGTGDWTPEQLDSYPIGVAALLAHMGAGPDRFLGHLEWAPSRKPDPHGWPGGMNGFRATLGTRPTPTPAPPEEDDMFTAFRSAPQYGGNGSIFLAGPGGWKPCYSMTLLGWYRHLGILRKGLDGDGAFAGSYTDISPAQIDHLAAMYTAGVAVPVPPSNIL